MKILVIGSGGREHALCWKLKQSSRASKIYVAPGNAGMESIAELVSIDVLDFEKLISFVKQEKIDLTVVGPEVPLVNGIVDAFEKESLKIFGPNKLAAIIEGSKNFAKDLMKKYQIPTAKYASFNNYEEAKKHILEVGTPIVIKADGLAAGKGVVVALNEEEALKALEDMFINNKYSSAAASIVIEEFLDGEEFSLMAFVNGENVYPMVIAKDHKRAYDNDLGPNTGGMGVYSPVPTISNEKIIEGINNIMIPTAKAMVAEGRPFVGILYGGLINTKDGVKTIEFNCRFGDPETEVILPRLESDLLEVILNILDNKEPELKWKEDACVGVVLASKGYPEVYQKGHTISGINEVNSNVFHMGTKKDDNNFVTNGGRVLLVTENGQSIEEARECVYKEINKIQCDNLFYRTDIGKRH